MDVPNGGQHRDGVVQAAAAASARVCQLPHRLLHQLLRRAQVLAEALNHERQLVRARLRRRQLTGQSGEVNHLRLRQQRLCVRHQRSDQRVQLPNLGPEVPVAAAAVLSPLTQLGHGQQVLQAAPPAHCSQLRVQRDACQRRQLRFKRAQQRVVPCRLLLVPLDEPLMRRLEVCEMRLNVCARDVCRELLPLLFAQQLPAHRQSPLRRAPQCLCDAEVMLEAQLRLRQPAHCGGGRRRQRMAKPVPEQHRLQCNLCYNGLRQLQLWHTAARLQAGTAVQKDREVIRSAWVCQRQAVRSKRFAWVQPRAVVHEQLVRNWHARK
mmetsp:Transcript_37274/g.110061  ORF Transcript_37274/g.110061 Transcript_37274/m.110061 type:complete len:322 (+) Transcript_37274:840-1805(+)